MRLCIRRTPAALLFLSAATAFGQQAPIVQPGAPGQSSRILSPEAARLPAHVPSAADIAFMQGMIMHHSQAVEMTGLLKTRGVSPALQELGKRISISQTDEM